MNLKPRRGPATTTPKQTRSGFAKFVLFVTAGVMAIALLAMFSTGWVQDAYGQTVPNPTATPTSVPPTATNVPPTATQVPPTATQVSPTATQVSPTATQVPVKAPTATATQPPTGQIKISKSASTTSPTVGQSFTFTLLVTNTGNGNATNVVATDVVPSNFTVTGATSNVGTASFSGNTVTANIGTLTAGQTATVTITVTANSAGAAVNSARVVGTNVGGAVETNGSNTVNLTVGGIVVPNPPPPNLPKTGQGGDSGNSGGEFGLIIALSVLFVAGVVVVGVRKRAHRS